MKSIVVIALLLQFVACSNQEQVKDEVTPFEEKVEKSSNGCMKQFNIKDLPEDFPEENDAAVTKDLKCFIKCVYVKVGLMNEAEEINADQIRRHMEPQNEAEAAELVEKCKQRKGNDACETAYNFSKCTNEAFKKLDIPK